MSQQTFRARWSFQYDDFSLDEGQVFQSQGARNDEKLLRLGYMEMVTGKIETHQCGQCGAKFTSIQERTRHGDKRHKVRDNSPDAYDDREERELERLAKDSPLFIEKSLASARG